MKQNDRELLLKDLCARLPYGVKCQIGDLTPLQLESVSVSNTDGCILNFGKDSLGNLYDFYLSEVKPYLRPLSSMTEDERKEFHHMASLQRNYLGDGNFYTHYQMIDWLNEHHFDYRGLIEKGLAIEAPEGMYK